MKTSWLSKISFQFMSDNKLVTSLLVYLVLLSKKKNNFTIGPLRTNNNGEITIKNENMIEAIENAKYEYPMDYDGSLDDCIGLELVVETIAELNDRLIRLNEFYPKEAEELEKSIKTCSNFKYKGKLITYDQPISHKFLKIILEKDILIR